MSFDLNMPAPRPDLRPDDVVLTGDRPTGALHLGHLSGSLASRVVAQDICPQTVLVADLQALTDHAHDPGKVRASVLEVVRDYLAVGIDPLRTRIVLQSAVPEISELALLLMNIVSEGRAMRNPTVRAEIEAKAFQGGPPLGFVVYPVSQAADILGFGATAVPVGDDQKPMLEITEELAVRLNGMGQRPIPVPRGIYPSAGMGRLPGTDGRKASKTLGNAISLGATPSEVAKCVKAMLSDDRRTSPADPGDPDRTVTFAYLRAFDPDREGLAALEAAYREGGVRDGDVKKRVVAVVENLLEGIRDRRARIGDEEALEALRTGTRAARATAGEVLGRVRARFGILEL
jgi:tryptophanyl-tRNA synthetase